MPQYTEYATAIRGIVTHLTMTPHRRIIIVDSLGQRADEC
jgi:hypothetical protein